MTVRLPELKIMRPEKADFNVFGSTRKPRISFSSIVRFFSVVVSLTVYAALHSRLQKMSDMAQREYVTDEPFYLGTDNKTINSRTKNRTKRTSSLDIETKNTTAGSVPLSLASFLVGMDLSSYASPISNASNLSLEEVSKGRELILSILKDAGINHFDPNDVIQLPLWSSISELYYSSVNDHDSLATGTQVPGPIIVGLDGCHEFRERVPAKDRFLGVVGNFNSGTTAFGIALQKNCRLVEHDSDNNWRVQRGRGGRRNVMSNVYGMLNQVPWDKHKPSSYRNQLNMDLLPRKAASLTSEHILPLVLVRDPFYWMQSMCKQGYGVRWDHDSGHHCPNLVPNEFDKQRFPSKEQVGRTSIPVWMGASPTMGPSWPSLIHYWNDWYESYYRNTIEKDSSDTVRNGTSLQTWPRLIIRFEDTLFYPREVMKEVCHCGGGRLVSEWDQANETSSNSFVFSLEESKPHHRHAEKSNFVTALIRYGTNKTRLKNMTKEDVQFAVDSLDPSLMKAFGYSFPQLRSDHPSVPAYSKKGRH